MRGIAMSEDVKTDKEREQMYEAEEDVRTLVRAKEIQADKKRFGRATKMAKTKLNEMKRVVKDGDDDGDGDDNA